VVTRPAVSLAQDRESTPAEPAVLTTMLRHQLELWRYTNYITLYLLLLHLLYDFVSCN